ncbi:MAG: ABC transporter permease [Anaerolineae bacterium]
MWRKSWIVARHEYTTNIRRPGFLIMTALVPVLGLVGLLIAAFLGGQATDWLERTFEPEAQRIGIVDESGWFTPVLPEYQDRFILFPDENAGRDALVKEEITALVKIPSTYLETGEVTLITHGAGLAAAILEESNTLRDFFIAHLVRGRVDDALAQRLQRPYRPIVTSLQGAETSGPMSFVWGAMVPYFLGTLLVVTIFTASGYLMRGVSEEKSSRVVEIILSSVTARELLAGKIVGLGALGLTQVAVWLASSAALSGGTTILIGAVIPLLTRPEIFVLSVIYYLLGFLVYATLMGAAASLGTTMQESQQLAGILSFTAAIPFFFAGFLFSNPNILAARALSWFPLTAPTMMLLRIPLAEVPWVDVAISIGSLLVTIPFLMWLAAKIFRMGLLMYGQRPGLRQIWQALRRA